MKAPMVARIAVMPVLALVVTLGTMLSGRAAPAPAAGHAVAAETPVPHAWKTSLHTMDRAIAATDTAAAELAWRDAYIHAIRSREWDALLAVGEGALRIGDHVGAKQPYRARARASWLTALFRAQDRRSVHGVLDVAEAFGRLGDTAVVVQGLRMADRLASLDGNADATGRAVAVRKRLVPGMS
jgi:hypothetical protein